VPVERPTFQRLRALSLSILFAVAAGGALAATDPQPVEAESSGQAQPLVADPVLEARVQSLAHKLRCLVCQNESIAESRAPLAIDLRNQVREQFAAGKNEDEVIEFLVTRYGDFVLYLPPFKPVTVLLWLGPVLFLVAGGGWLLLRLRSRAREPKQHLSDAERARAQALLAGAPAENEESGS